MKRPQLHIIVCALSVAAALSSVTAHAEDCVLTIRIDRAKPAYEVDEPIEAVATIENQGSADVRIGVAYPSLGGSGGPGLTLTASGSLKPAANAAGHAGAIEAITLLRPGERLTSRVYLQRFLTGFAPGHYDVAWTLDMPCLSATLTESGIAKGQGRIAFDVVRSPRATLAAVFEGYLKELEGTDSTRQREAAEALQASTSPLVIPYLERLPAFGYRQQAFDGLVKFAGNELARQFVRRALQSGKPADAIAALHVMSAWKEPLLDAEARTLLEKGGPSVQLEVLRYLGTTRDRAYLPLIDQYAASPDATVAAAARQARSVLTSR